MEMDQEIVSAVVDAQAQGMGGVVRGVPLGEGLPIISFFTLFKYMIKHLKNNLLMFPTLQSQRYKLLSYSMILGACDLTNFDPDRI